MLNDTVSACITAIHIAAAMIMAPKCDVRFYLNGVKIEPAPTGGIYLIATDGHRLLIIHDPSGYASRPFIFANNAEILRTCNKAVMPGVHTKNLKKVSRLIVENNMVYAATNALDIETEPYQFTPNTVACAWPFHEVDGKYPDWRRVIPTEKFDKDQWQGSITLNPKYVGDFEKISKLLGNASAGITIRPRSEHAPVVVEIPLPEETKAMGVIMPMRNDFPDVSAHGAAPSWIADELNNTKNAA